MLDRLDGDYDLAILDCAPSISLVSESVFRAADLLLVPLVPATLSVRTFEQLQEFLERRPTPPPDVLAFLSMVDRRKRLHRELAASLPLSSPPSPTRRCPPRASSSGWACARAGGRELAAQPGRQGLRRAVGARARHARLAAVVARNPTLEQEARVRLGELAAAQRRRRRPPRRGGGAGRECVGRWTAVAVGGEHIGVAVAPELRPRPCAPRAPGARAASRR